MANIVDFVAGTMPVAGSLVPATIIYRNVQVNLGFEPVEALIIGAIVEGMGFVTVTTALDLYEHSRDAGKRVDGSFWVALGGVALYILVVELVNAILDPGDSLHKLTLGLLSTFGLLGGLMVALRNQLMKRRAAIWAERLKQAEQEQQERDLQLERERQERVFKQKLKEEKLHLAHELKLKKLESSAGESSRESSKRSEKVSDGALKYPETFGKWKDWRKLPETEKKVIAEMESSEQVEEVYGVQPKTAGNWLKNAKGG